MTQNNKRVYEFSVDYDTTIGIDKLHAHNTVGIFEDIDDAIKAALANSDDDWTEQDARDGLEDEGTVDICWHSMKVGELYANHVVATLTEHVLITSSKGS